MFRMLRWRVRHKYARLARGLRYGFGRMTQDDAEWLLCDAKHVAGLYPLEWLAVDTVLEQARDRWGEHPALTEMASRACSRVYDKWSCDGHNASAAEDWAMDLIADYARDRGIKLVDSWSVDTEETEDA